MNLFKGEMLEVHKIFITPTLLSSWRKLNDI